MSSKNIPYAMYEGMSDSLIFTFEAELRDAYNFVDIFSDILRSGYPETYRCALEDVIKEKYQELYSLMGSSVRFDRKLLYLGTRDLNRLYSVKNCVRNLI